MHEWFAPRQQEMPLQVAGALHFFPACIQIWHKAVVPSPFLHLRAFCWEGLEGRDSDQRAACLPDQNSQSGLGSPCQDHIIPFRDDNSGPDICAQTPLNGGHHPYGHFFLALRYIINTLTSVLHQLHPSGWVTPLK